MQNFEDYTPEMLVYYNSLSEPLKRRLWTVCRNKRKKRARPYGCALSCIR